MNHCTLEIGEEILDVSYEHTPADPGTGFQGRIEIDSIYYEGTDLIFLAHEIPGFYDYIVEKVWEEREEKKPVKRSTINMVKLAESIMFGV